MHSQLDLYFFELPLYTALIALAALVGLLIAYLYLRWRSRRHSQGEIFLDGAVLVFAAGWIGARAYHVLTHWDYYQARPAEIAHIGWLDPSPVSGGLGIRGGFLLGLLALALYARGRQLSFWSLADASALGLAIGQAIGWVGALVQGANYGVVSDSRLAVELHDLYGLVEPRFPLQHVEIVFFVVLFLALIVLAAQRRRAGTLFIVYLLLASLGNGLLGFQRGDETAHLGELRIDQWVDGLFAIAAVGMWLWRRPTAATVAPARLGQTDKWIDA